MKNLLKLISCIVIISALSGCAGWPPKGHGGLAEYHLETLPPVMPDQPLGPEHGLRFELELVRQHLDILVLEGAELCFPATVIQAKHRQNRITRELHGDLRFDAANDLLIQRNMLVRLERQLDYVNQNDICTLPKEKNQTEIKSTEDVSKQKNSNEVAAQPELLKTPGSIGQQIYKLLNTDNQFAFGSSELNPKYIIRLAEAVQLISKHPGYHLKITGHADAVGEKENNLDLSLKRAQKVGRYLQILGLSPKHLQFDAVGSNNPLFDGKEAHVRLVNRRVSIELIETGLSTRIATE